MQHKHYSNTVNSRIPRMTGRRGLGLASVLVCAALLFLVAFVLLATALASRSLVGKAEEHTRARNLAEAAVYRAIVRLRQDPLFGSRPADMITVTLPGDAEGATGTLQFTGADASTNNLQGDVARPGWRQRPVPGGTALLVGTGRCGSTELRVPVLVQRSAFPFVLASEGPLLSTGATRVGTLATGTRAELLPGDLASNAAVETAVQLGDRSWIGGDVRSAGGIVLAPQAQVQGRTFTYGEKVKLPEIDLDRYDPLLQGIPFQNLPILLGNEVLAGPSRCSTDLVVQGRLTLEGATLFVAGNLTITGGLRGSGLVVVKGSTTIGGGAQLESDRHAVLLSAGDVKLQGLNAGASSFHGLVYTEGGFAADHITLVGTFVARGDRGTVLDSAQVLFDPEVDWLGDGGSVLNPGSASNSTQATTATTLSAATGLFSTLSLRGSWTAADGPGSSAPQPDFNLNDFLGESQPLQIVTWGEER